LKLVATSDPPAVRADWAEAASAGELAIVAYELAKVRYRLEDARLWKDLEPHEQQAWIARAAEWLKEVEPEKCIWTGCRNYRRPNSDYCSDLCAVSAENDR
jgi:hypothetical protein